MGYSTRVSRTFERGNRAEAIKILNDGINYYSDKLLKGISGGIEEDDMSIVLALMEIIAQAVRESLPWQLARAADALKPIVSATSVKISVTKREREDDRR